MIQGGEPKGYTIVEVMIFLAVTAVLFVSAVLAVSGRQAAVQFSQSLRDAQSQIDSVINQVASGFYPNPGTFTCKVTPISSPAAIPKFTAVNNPQGSSDDCTFIGKVVQFTDSGGTSGADNYNVYSIAGRRFNSSSQNVTSIKEAHPIAVSNFSVGSPINLTTYSAFQFALKVTRVTLPLNPVDPSSGKYPAGSYGGAASNYGSVAFFSTLPSFSGSSSNSGANSQRVSVGVIPTSALTDTESVEVGKINALTDPPPPPVPLGFKAINFNPANGIVICLADQGDKRKAMITIGGGINLSTTKLDIGSYDTGICP